LIQKAELRGPLRELAVNATLQSLEGEQMTLALPASHFGLAVEPMTGQLQDKLAAALGRPVKLRFVRADAALDTPAARDKAARAERQAEAEHAINEDPLVQSLMRDFGARVVPQSVKPFTSPHSEPHS
jgi:DNA polymerase-3 subunit gamma/tau